MTTHGTIQVKTTWKFTNIFDANEGSKPIDWRIQVVLKLLQALRQVLPPQTEPKVFITVVKVRAGQEQDPFVLDQISAKLLDMYIQSQSGKSR